MSQDQQQQQQQQQQHEQPGYRSTLAVHVAQSDIPLGSASDSGVGPRGSKYLDVPGSAQQQQQQQRQQQHIQQPIYSPQHPTSPTPLQRLYAQHCGDESDFDLICAPLSNGSWRSRWERMCVAGPSTASASTSRMLDANGHLLQPDEEESPEEELAHAREAEVWRLAGAFNRGEVNATRSDETAGLLAMAADWLELDSEIEGIRFDSELALKQEVAYAAHLHVSNLILPAPRNPANVTDYARAVANILAVPGYLTFSIRIPVSDVTASPAASSSEAAAAVQGGNASTRTWEMWNTIRSMCAYSPRLSVCLDLSTPLPGQHIYSRWFAEPVKSIFLPASSYLANAKGYPVLSKNSQSFCKQIFKYKPAFILSGIHKGLHQSGGPEAYTSYIRFLERKTPISDPLEQFAGAYMDYLQAPLQPLMDNLENDTYEGFERDPVKYRQYEEAVYQALMERNDWSENGRSVIVFVCGAGRGPLVEGCLRASQRAQVNIELTAVEKNPNAFVILQERKATQWGDAVQLVFSDMRSFTPSVQADIIVSELLGSFGDNELSPECLDGVMRCLSPAGISIPCSYTSFLAPVSSNKLHSEIANSSDPKYPEQPYVVMFQAAQILSEAGGRENYPKYAECWGFDHPRHDIVCDSLGLPLTNHHNARTAHVTFNIPYGGICHGFAGYFDAILYGDIGISIHPERMDPNMLSWFPLFFPLKEPLYLPPRSELDVHIFRLVDGVRRRVWFEWMGEVFLPLPAMTLAPSPTHASSIQTAGQTGANGSGVHASVRQPRAASPMDARSVSAAGVPIHSPMMDNFAPIPSPFIGNDSMSSAGFMLDVQRSHSLDGIVRLKVGQSKLHNPAGRGSWVGL